jgi:hypothetical protein
MLVIRVLNFFCSSADDGDPRERRVRCFYCGCELHGIGERDNVWEEHVRASPNCIYLRAIWGEEEVQRIERRLGRK